MRRWSARRPKPWYFVSGGTEANHLAILGAARQRVLVSAVEHDSVLQAAPAAELIPVDRDGVVRLDLLDLILGKEPTPALVSVMLANNETGVIQPVAEIAAVAHARGALFHCDAVQAAGKIPLDGLAIGADLVTLSAHKIGGPPGVGALLARAGLDLMPAPAWRRAGARSPRRYGKPGGDRRVCRRGRARRPKSRYTIASVHCAMLWRPRLWP